MQERPPTLTWGGRYQGRLPGGGDFWLSPRDAGGVVPGHGGGSENGWCQCSRMGGEEPGWKVIGVASHMGKSVACH